MSARKYLPLLLSACVLFCFFYFRLYHFFSPDSLLHHRHLLLQWKEEHYLQAVLLYICLYSAAVGASFPGAVFFTLAGGFLFGVFPGFLYVILSATLGSIFLYLAVNLAFASWFHKKAGHWARQLERGFQENAFYYLLSLRLIPIFPFFVLNIVAGLLALPLRIFIGATLLGLIPGALIYTSIGQNLGSLLEHGRQPLAELLLQPRFILPLLALALLALLPVVYGHFKSKNKLVLPKI